MKPRHLLALDGVLAVLFGLVFIAAPGPLLSLFGIAPDPSREFLARALGAFILGYGPLQWWMRDRDARSVLVVMRSLFFVDVAALAISLHAVLTGLLNPLGWGFVALFAFLLAARGWFGFLKANRGPEQSPQN